jgi:methylase of polypeptide subunit release factors
MPRALGLAAELERRPGLDPPAMLRPSEYTAALIQVLLQRAEWVRGAEVLEIGSGSGVVLAALGAMGAASLCGVDIEAEAVAAGALLLEDLGLAAIASVVRGDMWRPVLGRQFDLIAANLPEFPTESARIPGRLPSWSAAGASGRALLDRFLEGLPAYLAPGGRAVIAHNGFLDLARSRTILEEGGLSCHIAATVLVHIAAEKLELMTPGVLRKAEGPSIRRYGPYAFAELHILEIGRGASLY